jgi:hypothetical protein
MFPYSSVGFKKVLSVYTTKKGLNIRSLASPPSTIIAPMNSAANRPCLTKNRVAARRFGTQKNG